MGLRASGLRVLSIPPVLTLSQGQSKVRGRIWADVRTLVHMHLCGTEGADVALFYDELEHRHHGEHFDTPLLPALLVLKLFLIIFFLLLF